MFVESAGNALLDWAASILSEGFNSLVQIFYSADSEFFSNPTVQGIIAFFTMLAWGLFLVGMILAIAEFGLTYREGSGNFKNIGMGFLKGFLAVLLFASVPIELYKFSCDMQSYVASAISTSSMGSAINGVSQGMQSFISNYLEITRANMTNPLTVLCYILMYLYCVFKIFFGNIKRAGILTLTICVGSLHMMGIPRGYQDSFMAWCRQVIGICLTVFLQNTMFLVGLLMTLQNPGSWLISLGAILVAAQTPRFVQMFGVDCSAQGNIGAAVYTASTTVRTVKMLFAKG